MVKDNTRGRSRTPRSGTSTVTSKSSLIQQESDGEVLLDRVPTAYDYHSACSEDEWLDEKSKASRYSVGGKNSANRTKSLISDDEEEEEEADERDEAYDHFDCGDDEDHAGDVGSVDKYSHSSKKADKGNDTKRPTTIDRLWSASMDSDTQQFQGVAYKGSVFGGGFDSNDAKKKKPQVDDKETNPTMLEPIYDTPRKKKSKKSMATRFRNSIAMSGNGAGDQTKTSENNSKQTANKSTADTKGKSTVSGTTTSSKRELKKKPTDEISTEIDGSITSSITDPLEYMLLNSKSDPNKVVRDIETKLDLLRAMAAEVDGKKKSIKDKKKKGKGSTDDKSKKSSLEKTKDEKKAKEKSVSKTKKSSSSRSRSRSKSRSRSESRSRSRSRSQGRKSSSSKTGTKRTSTSDSATSRSRSRSRTTKRTSSSSAKDSNGTSKSKTPKIPIATSDAVFSNAPTEHRKNSSSKEVAKEHKARKSDASKKETSDETKEKKKTASSSSSRKSSQSRSRSKSRSRSARKSSDGHSIASSRRSRSSSKRHRSSSSKTSKERSRSSRHRISSTPDRSSSRRRKSTNEPSRSHSRKSKSGPSRSLSRHSTQSERSRGKSSASRKRTDVDVSKKKKKKRTQFKGSKYLMDTDLKEESVERARYELTQEMIELLEKVKLEEMQKKNKLSSNDKAKDTRLFKKRKDILNNFANFFRKSKKNEEVILSSPHSGDSFTDNDAYNTDYSVSHKKSRRSGASEGDTYTESKIIKIGSVVSNDQDDENDENYADDIIESETCGTSLKENGTKSTNIDKANNGTNILGESNKQQATKPLSAEKTKKATELRKAAIKQAAARKLAAAEKQKAAEEAKKRAEEARKSKLEAKAKAKEEKKKNKNRKKGEEKLDVSAHSKRDATILKGRTNDTSSMKSDEVENDDTTTEGKVSEKKAKVVKRFAADKKKALHDATSKNTSADQSDTKDFTDAVEATRSVSDWELKQNDSVVKRLSTGGKKNNEKGTKKKRASKDATDNESKTTMTTVTKIPEHLVAKSNPLEIDEYSFTKELANEPGMVQCLRFYSCGRTADVLNVAIHVSDTCTGNDDYQYPVNNLKKDKKKKSKYGNNDHGDVILQNRSIVTETEDYPTNASIIDSPPRHMPTVEVILEEETNPLVLQQVVPGSPPEQRDDMAKSFGTLTDSDDESLEEAPELKMARVQSFILDVSQMKLHLDEDSQEKRTREAIRRGIASAEEISITSIQVPTFDASSKETTIDTVSDDARDEADNGDDDDSSTESGVVDEDSVSHNPETPTNKSKGRRVQHIFSRFRNIRKSKKIFSM